MKVIKPIRAAHSYTQRLVAGPATVFPLLCPVREGEWIAGWDPLLVVSSTGVAEADCVFTRPLADGSEADITYTHTSLGPEGDAFVASFSAAYYREFMLDWELRLNHYLQHGTAL